MISGRGSDVELSAAAAIPYASLGVRVGDGPQQLLILATDTSGEQLWAASSHLALFIRHGRIVRTSGLDKDLTSVSWVGPNQQSWTEFQKVQWTADFADIGRYGIAVKCDLSPAGQDPIEILGARIETYRVEERCQSADLRWSFINTYWISSNTGRVWRSVQYVHPDSAPVEVEILRPPLSRL